MLKLYANQIYKIYTTNPLLQYSGAGGLRVKFIDLYEVFLERYIAISSLSRAYYNTLTALFFNDSIGICNILPMGLPFR
jgi:hypothetical protein